MTINEAIKYLQPIADSSSLPRYTEALNTAIAAMKYQKERIAGIGNTIDHNAEVGKMVYGRLQRVYEDSLGWVDRCSCCKTIVDDEERECPNCGAHMKDGE